VEVSGRFHASVVLHPGKELLLPTGEDDGGPQSQSEFGGEEINSQPLPGNKHPLFYPVAQRYTNDLSRLLYEDKPLLNKVQRHEHAKLNEGVAISILNIGTRK
jgi:hypothetical protein